MWDVQEFVKQLQRILVEHAGVLRDQEHSSLLGGDPQTALNAAVRADEVSVVGQIVTSLAKRYQNNA